MPMPSAPSPWWRYAVIYQVYPRSWADADGDGLGDLPGITSRLPHLVELGVDAVWISPFYPSPQRDAGYDVADYRDVDPRFGTLDDFDALIERAHALGLKVIVDLVPNHSSSDHPWFQEALAAAPGSPERARYIFRDGRGPGGDSPPNNWRSKFGGSAWTRITEADGSPGQWYLHLFDESQPDFDWSHAEVRSEFEDILRFWLDRGVDGFRIDVAHGMVKTEGFPDAPDDYDLAVDPTASQPMWDQPAVHDIFRSWRRLVDTYDGDRLLCAEAWVRPDEALARYVRPDECHHSFNFGYLMTPWRAADQRESITRSLEAVRSVGAVQTWVLSNHDVVRHATRLAVPQTTTSVIPGIGPDDPQPDAELGLRRARAATALMLALPGAAYLYQGEELGLPEATTLPPDVRQDPTFWRSDDGDVGRDGCRVPVPWEADRPAFGFNETGATWLPQPAVYGQLSVDRQRGVPDSTFELYRSLLALRRDRGLGRGELSWLGGFGTDVVAFAVVAGGTTTTVLANLGDTPLALPSQLDVLVTSGPARRDLLPDTTVWLDGDLSGTGGISSRA
ncbi:glycoside hydrolase family 13 protein [Aeromicrobium phragmitis]|uniref:Glycoside hydrolase family 13 protein n=2 Tax=Aeromicrobium phragmitis TaxID=2478914 RepID=A0A3L8PKT1_9ACTN|nr:glycoside hydrolase family 13 protein [Aeromicrobium phragmitis]